MQESVNKKHNWMRITGAPWVLEIVKGYKLELDCKPAQHKPPPPLIMSRKDIALTQTEIEKMVTKGAIVPVAPCDRISEPTVSLGLLCLLVFCALDIINFYTANTKVFVKIRNETDDI